MHGARLWSWSTFGITGATVGKPVRIVNVTERTKSVRPAPVVMCGFVVVVCFFYVSIYGVCVRTVENCLFFYFFLVYFDLFEEGAVCVVWDRRYLWNKEIPGQCTDRRNARHHLKQLKSLFSNDLKR